MTGITAKVIADSINPEGVRLTSVQARYPRIILAEQNTHRALSRSTRSSRAVPISVMMREVRRDPAMPVEFGGAKSGMQSSGPLTGWRARLARSAYRGARWPALVFAWVMLKAGAHKQVANRILEPWAWSDTIITATEWENYFALRDHPDADPTMRALAVAIRRAMQASQPTRLDYGVAHMPYVEKGPVLCPREMMDVSAARCARVSYTAPSGQSSMERDWILADQLRYADPMHASPFEHVAIAERGGDGRNFGPGWTQYRAILEAEE